VKKIVLKFLIERLCHLQIILPYERPPSGLPLTIKLLPFGRALQLTYIPMVDETSVLLCIPVGERSVNLCPSDSDERYEDGFWI
jgi:hypothetical protein